MRIITLMENSPGAAGCIYGHGLSLYIETERHRILLDTGPDASFAANAARLGVNLKGVDICVLSHGHYDHAGGLMTFAGVNPSAPIYLQQSATLDYYADDPGDLHYIGIDKAISHLPSAVLLDGSITLDDELQLLSGVHGCRLQSKSNGRLKQLTGGRLVPDDFCHEQALAACSGGTFCLFSGCSHLGIVNWMDRFHGAYGRWPDVAVGGFHFMKHGDYSKEEESIIRHTAQEMERTGTLFYTGHCTGERAFGIMKEIMGGQLRPLHSGMAINLQETRR